MKIPLTVIIPAKNEALNIEDAINSVQQADEIFVVDSQSTDGTIELAEKLGAKVVQFHYDGGWPKKKNWAIRNLPVKNDWILILDADERLTPALADEIASVISSPGAVKGYYMRWKFVFLNRWQKHSWNHGWMLRLFKKGYGEYEDIGMRDEGGWDNEVHENIIVDGETACLKEWLPHESNQSLSFWIRKQNEFSDWNAKRRLTQLEQNIPSLSNLWSKSPLERRKLLKAIYLRLPCKSVLLFVYLYVLKRGFLDGKAGFYFCALRAIHEFNISAKLYELNQKKKP
jgi:glycosyltransferase involved in cell wall biosynthesis